MTVVEKLQNDFQFKPTRQIEDAFHQNDVKPRPRHLADDFPPFEKGGSSHQQRSLNLIAVLDRETLEAKWWNQGLTIRQHDPDRNSHEVFYSGEKHNA